MGPNWLTLAPSVWEQAGLTTSSFSLRRITRQNETIRGLIVNPYPAVDQLLLTVAVRMVPGLAIFVAVFGFNMLGDGVRDALDPRGVR